MLELKSQKKAEKSGEVRSDAVRQRRDRDIARVEEIFGIGSVAVVAAALSAVDEDGSGEQAELPQPFDYYSDEEGDQS